MGKHTGQSDVPLYGSQSQSEGLEALLRISHQEVAPRPAAASSAGYRGMLTEPASEPILGNQVWSMKLIGTLDTAFTDKEGNVRTVDDVLPEIMWKVSTWKEYEYLLQSFRVYGQQVPVRAMVPVEGIPNRLRDGINRIAIAEFLGWDSMMVTWGILEKSMWEDWDKSPQGLTYHKAKAQRLGLN